MSRAALLCLGFAAFSGCIDFDRSRSDYCLLHPESPDCALDAGPCPFPDVFVDNDGGALVGDTVVEAADDVHPGGLADASSFVAVNGGTVFTLTAWYSSGNAPELDLGLYDDLGGHPNNLLTVAKVSCPIAGNWVTGFVDNTSITLTAGVTYWIALLAPLPTSNNFAFRYRYDAALTTNTEHSMEGLTQLPAIWTTGATFPNTVCSFYASAYSGP